ncbi:MAG TPA: hypothetical protein V6D26_23260, partial [Stenomitos sp.]
SECNQAVASKICVANVTVQINSDEPQLVTYSQRIPLKTGDTLRVLDFGQKKSYSRYLNANKRN